MAIIAVARPKPPRAVRRFAPHRSWRFYTKAKNGVAIFSFGYYSGLGLAELSGLGDRVSGLVVSGVGELSEVGAVGGVGETVGVGLGKGCVC